MQLNRINRRAAEVVGFVKVHWLAFLMMALGLLICVNSFQRWNDRRAVEANAEQIRQFDAARKQEVQRTQELFTILDKQNESTQNILAAVRDVNGIIKTLIENDRRQDSAVNDLKQEYINAKNPNSNDENNTAARRVRRALPVGERERRALAADRELYPATANGN